MIFKDFRTALKIFLLAIAIPLIFIFLLVFSVYEKNPITSYKSVEKALLFPHWDNWTRLVRVTDRSATKVPSGLENLTRTEYFYIRSTQITEIPSEIGKMSSLKWLAIDYNKIVTLPNSIGNLSNLEELHIYSNNISSLPDEIGNLHNLKILNVSDNNLTKLPDTIENLSNLKVLNISNNQISEDEIGNLKTKLPNTNIII